MALLLGLSLVGCKNAETKLAGPMHRVVEDDLGNAVRLPREVRRAVSLAPSVTEMIFAVGANDRLVGVTTYCDFPEAASGIEKVGDTQTPNIERIVALRPDVVFVSTASQLESFTKTLDEQGITVFVIDPVNLEQVFSALNQLGEIFGTEPTAENQVAALSARSRNIDRIQGPPWPRVFVQVSREPLFTIGKDSFLSAVIQDAGGLSVTANIPTAYPNLSKETAAAMNPDVIILSDSEDNREPNEVFKNSPAVRSGRVYRVNADIISRPGPRLVDALEEIARVLHP